MTELTKVDTLEFESPINLERSCGLQPVADKAKSVMELYLNKENADIGFIEWSVPELDMFEGIGLTFETDDDGTRKLTDYDGVMTLPTQAMDLLEKNGVDCAEMRRSMPS